jgi:hypothetical protein
LAPPSSSSSSSSVSLKASLSNRWRSAKLDLRKLAADGYVAAPPSIDTGSMLWFFGIFRPAQRSVF